MAPEFVTIGAYGFDAESFFRTLQDARVDSFCDIRARRGVRGSEYAFANSNRLQLKLGEMGIRYLHMPALAPARAIRDVQANADRSGKTAKRLRTALDPLFIQRYHEECLSDFDTGAFLEGVGAGSRRVALFCVEREPEACHRSLLAARLEEILGTKVEHLMP